jgi:cytochrome c peroxidase
MKISVMNTRRFILTAMLSTMMFSVLPASRAAVPDIGPLPPVPENPDNKATPQRIELGKKLFFDNRISKTGKLNCSSCHIPETGWTLPTKFSLANDGFVERRNSPTLLNVGYNKGLIWDGRAPTLEKQAIGSTKNPVHKGQDMDYLMKVLNDDPQMVQMFQAAYGSKPNVEDYGKAIAVFERHTIITGDSAFDRYMKGDKKALSAAAIKGMKLFKGKAGCMQCHNGANFTDSDYHNIGLARNPDFDQPELQKILKFDAKRMGLTDWETVNDDPGRYLVTHKMEDWKKFKTPTLRNLEDTKPYMHDGRFETLAEVIEYYNRGGDKEKNQDKRIKPLKLSAAEKQQLITFLESLRGALPKIEY